MIITASLVKELRERTGAGMMECKKALEEASGDIDSAITIMRKSGQAKAAKAANRVAAEGVISIKIDTSSKRAFMVEVNCETDFVARDREFLNFVNFISTKGLEASVQTADALLSIVLDNGKTITQLREDIITKIGENINIRRVKSIVTQGSICYYVHNNSRIGVLVELSIANNPDLGKDIAMHIAACKPMVILPQDISQDILNKEKEIYLAQVQTSGKPPEILEKMVVGRMQKFITENTLIKQAFVKDPNTTVEKLLQQTNASILSFTRFEVGEGIEKKSL